MSLRTTAFALGLVALAGLAAHDRAAAQSPKPLPDTVDAYGIVFDQWVKDYEPKTAILVVRRGGKTVFAKGHGADPQKPTLIASLSKAITGACIATLVRDGKLSFTTPLRDALPQFFKQYGAPVDQRLNDATVEELLVHRAGLRGNADDDSIYGIFAKRASGGHGWQAAPKTVLSEYLLKDRLARHPGGRYSYSNTGYEILSAIIEEQTGKSYEDYCGEAVFGELGLAVPKLHPDWRMLAGMGGWFIPGPDYLAFLDIFDPEQSVSRRHRQSLDRSGADPLDADQPRPLVQPRREHLGGRAAAGRCRTAASCIRVARIPRASRSRARSSATRSGPPTASRCSSRWNGRRKPKCR